MTTGNVSDLSEIVHFYMRLALPSLQGMFSVYSYPYAILLSERV
jgi:hypothetical protein